MGTAQQNSMNLAYMVLETSTKKALDRLSITTDTGPTSNTYSTEPVMFQWRTTTEQSATLLLYFLSNLTDSFPVMCLMYSHRLNSLADFNKSFERAEILINTISVFWCWRL